MNTKSIGIGLLLVIVLILVSSWLLVHVLAVLGIFLAVAYPIWWFFAPQKTVCFLCRAKQNGDWCPLCRKKIIKENGVSPRGLFSAVANGSLIFIFSLVSLAIVFGESQLLFKLGFPPTSKTASFVIPDKGQYRLGEIFPMKIEIEGMKTSINTVQSDLGFDSEKLELIDISTEGSFANVFIQKEINNEAGYARLTGGVPNPGYLSEKGTFGTFYFKGKSPGLVKIEFLPSSQILANDGRGSNVLHELSAVSYLVLPERISKEEEDLQTNAFSSSGVLGAESNQTQFTFYDQTDVLGIKTENNSKQDVTNIKKSPLEFLQELDSLILQTIKEIT